MANDSGFLEIIELLRNGELVRAGTANRAPSQIDQNVRYLRDLFEAAALGETVYARGRTVDADDITELPEAAKDILVTWLLNYDPVDGAELVAVKGKREALETVNRWIAG